jgi:hypothetical protein
MRRTARSSSERLGSGEAGAGMGGQYILGLQDPSFCPADSPA